MGDAANSTDRRILTAAIVLGVVFVVGAIWPTDPDFDVFFGVDVYGSAGMLALPIGLVVLIGLAAVPGAAGRVGDGLARTVGRLPGPVLAILLAGGAVAAFYALPMHRLSGDAVPVVMRAAHGDIYPSNPLTDFLFQLSQMVTGAAAPAAVRLVSMAAGAVHVVFALLLARECLPAGPRRAGLAVLLLTPGTAALFFGAIEVYAPLAAGITVYLWFGARCLTGRGGIIGPALALGTTFALHGSAGLLLPSLLVLANGGKVFALRIGRILLASVLFLVPVAIVYGALYFLVWRGDVPEAGAARYGSFLGGWDQGPLLPLVRTSTNVLYRYALLDAEHILGVLSLLLRAAPAGLLLFLLAPKGSRKGPLVAFAAVASFFLVLFPLVWNVNYPLRSDWDLFSPMGIPLVLLGGLAFLREGTGRAAAVKVGALSLFGLVPLVLANAGGPLDVRRCALDLNGGLARALEIGTDLDPARARTMRAAAARYLEVAERLDPTGVGKRIDRAMDLARAGHLPRAEASLREVLADEPTNPAALEGLGSVLLTRKKTDEAEKVLRAALVVEPWSLQVRVNLARIRFEAGDVDGAIAELEQGLRTGGGSFNAPQVIAELARLRRSRGDDAIARELLRQAEIRWPGSVPGAGGTMRR